MDHQQKDETAVAYLATAMNTKLARARAKGRSGWDTPECTQQHLSNLLREHVEKGDPVDVANFCAFLAARGEGIAPRQCLAQIEEPAGAAPAAAAPFGYVNTQTGQFFTDVEPCRRGNEGHWRTVYLQPSAVAGAVATGWRLVPATPTREWIASVADGGYEDCDCASLIADILSRAPAAPALEAPPAVAPQGEYPHEQMDAMALARYKVVPSHASMLWSHAVVAGDGAQQLYVGREVECQNMARKFAGAFLDGAFAFHSMAAAPTAQAATALEAPAAPDAPPLTPDEARRAARFAELWNGPSDATSGSQYALAGALAFAAKLAAAPQAPAAQVIENLLQLARIVNTAVEDWGESFEDGSSEVTFHKEEADKLEEILEFFDSLPDAPPEEGVILSGPSRAARVLRAMAAPAAPVVDAGDQVLGEWPRVSGVGRDAESPRTLLLYLQTEASDDELRAIHDALLDGGALATHALSELMHIGYRVEGGKLVPPENLSVRASEFFGVTAVAAKATAVHSDDVAVDRFAVEMKAKLAAARAKGRGGWETCPPEVLSRMLREHADKGDPRDVANFCMFLWSLGQPISVAAPAAPAVDAQGERDAAFEAVRNRLCSLQRYSFVLDDDGIVRRAHDRTGSWIEFDDAHALFDPVAVDAAIAAQAKEGGAPVADAAPLDVCTDPYNCARCKTHPAHRGDMHHAGISRIGGSA